MKKKDSLRFKGIAIMMMIVHHLYAFPERVNGQVYSGIIPDNLLLTIALFFKICVAIYLILAGYAMTYSIENGKFSWKNNLYRISNLYLLALSTLILFVPILISKNVVSFEISTFIKNLFGISTSYNHEWWFLLPYVLMTLFTPFIYKRINNNRSLIIMLALSLAIGLEMQYTIGNNILTKTLINYPAYIMGILLYKNKKLLQLKFSFIELFFMLSFLIFLRGHFIERATLDFIFGMLFIIICINYVQKDNVATKVLEYLGARSSYIWLIHSFFIYYLFQDFIFNSHQTFLIFLKTLLVSIIASYIVQLIKYILTKAFKNAI